MARKIISAIAALSLSLAAGSAAFAQTTDSVQDPGRAAANGEMMWPGTQQPMSDEEIGAFYTDETMSEMRPAAEITAYLQGLSEEERTQYINNCTMDTEGEDQFEGQSKLVCDMVNQTLVQ